MLLSDKQFDTPAATDITSQHKGVAMSEFGTPDAESDPRVVVQILGHVAHVRLNRPAKLNALDGRMFTELAETGDRLARTEGVRAVVLSGSGRAFCAGLDLGSFTAMTQTGGAGRVSGQPLPIDGPARALGQQAVHVWAQLPVPVIAAVHGVAFGGGLQIALGADIRLVTPDARLSVMEIKWGLIPDMTGTQVLPQLVGIDHAKELTFTGRIVDGRESAALGLVTRTEVDPVDAALKLAQQIAGNSPDAVRQAKALLDLAGRCTLTEGFAAEQVAIRSLIGSPNQIEAVEAQQQKRPASFTD